MNSKTTNFSKTKFVTLMLLPTLVVLAVMTVYPMASSIYYSFTDFKLLKKSINFVGITNYISLLKNEYFVKSIITTVKFTICSVVLEMFVGFCLALYVNSIVSIKIQKILRTLLLLPYLLPTVTVALIWRIMLSVNYGIINSWLDFFHLPVYNWFSDMKTALGMLIAIDVWQNAPFVFLLIYASMQAIPKAQYEAAKMDGADFIKTTFFITIPNLKVPIALCAMLRTIDSFRIFDKVNLLTGGGPANSTTTISEFIYKNGIKSLKFGIGSAGSLIMAVLVFALSIFYIRRALGNTDD